MTTSQQRLAQQSVTITKDGKEQLFAIEWERVEHPPCDPEQISHIKTDGKIWLVAASIDSNDVFFRSEDGRNWRQIQIDLPQYKVWLDNIEPAPTTSPSSCARRHSMDRGSAGTSLRKLPKAPR